VGLSNYIRAFSEDSDFINAMLFTGKFTLVSVVLINLFAFSLALLLTRTIRGTNLFRTTFFMPNLIGGIVLGYIWLLIINGILINLVDITYNGNLAFGAWSSDQLADGGIHDGHLYCRDSGHPNSCSKRPRSTVQTPGRP
jgi:raffinose/stachyose/melibiose transport system permease protein